MYGIIAFNKEGNPQSTEFCAEIGKYRRGWACNGCRIARVKCSGRLDGSHCNRCKRLSTRCLYPNHSRNRQPGRDGRLPPECNRKDTEANTPTSPKLMNPAGPLNLTSWEDIDSATDGPLELDFDAWFQPPNASSTTELPQSHTELAIALPFDELSSPQHLLSSQTQESQRDGEVYTDSTTRSSESVESEIDDDGLSVCAFANSNSPPGLKICIAGATPSASSCNCLQAMTSSLSGLRSWKQSGSNMESKASSITFNHIKAENFLVLFEKSMTRLRMVENCSLACILSQDLSILLLLIIEQLANLLSDLIEGLATSPLDDPQSTSLPIGHDPHQADTHSVVNKNVPPTRDIRRARIGTFEIRDPLDLEAILKSLLRIRMQALDAYISRWDQKIQEYGLKSLTGDLERIRKNLSRISLLI
ncbi:hypothetical protein F5B17DRAFT_448131 [Nemania serpens]|nr:hypothetical protein F5B17DRAFT_448131 [Nemania serpens]